MALDRRHLGARHLARAVAPADEDRCRSVAVAGAVVSPAVVILGVVQPVELMGVVIQTVGCRLGLVIVLTVVASRRSLFGALADDVELLARQLHDLSRVSSRSMFLLSPGSVDYDDALIISRRAGPHHWG